MAVNTESLWQSALSTSHVTALQDAAVLLTGFVFDAVNDLSRGVSSQDTWLAEYLPKRYERHYDEVFGRRFLTCLIHVAGRLWGADAYRPACVAEQLAFCALLDFAQATLEERGVESDFGPLWERAYDDLGLKTLYDESHAVESRLEFTEWFRPIDDAPIHPSIQFRECVHARIS